MAPHTVKVKYIKQEIDLNYPSNPIWEQAEFHRVTTDWKGDQAPVTRHFSFGLLCSDDAIHIKFIANIGEPLVVSKTPIITEKSIGLWDRDVCEIFIAPDKNRPQKYFEFEAAPTGEWLDVAIDLTSGQRVADWEYMSGMSTASQINETNVVTAIKIPWTAFGDKPKPGDVWLGNLLRCVGKDPDRGYLAWQPTFTDAPNFHVPDVFGELKFLS